MSVEVREIITSSDLKKFIRFPHELYKNNPNWVPPLEFDEMNTFRRDKNPAYDNAEAAFWLAYKDGRVVGRIAGIISRSYIESWGHKNARFGWIDFVDDAEVSKALLDTVEKWALEKGMTAVHGPLGFTDMDHEGMLVEGFDELGTMATIYNHPYYPQHMERLGYEKDVDWIEFEITVPDAIPEKAQRIADIVREKRGVRVLEATHRKEMLPYGRELFNVLNASFSHLYGFVQLSSKQIDLYIKQYFGFIDPDFVIILLDSDGKVAGFVIAMPSLSRALQKSGGRLFPLGFLHIMRAMGKHNDRLDLYLGAIRPDYQGKGLDALLMTELTKSAMKRGMKLAETNVELETNVLVQGHWKYFQSRQHKRRRCFIKDIA
jgi:ribosomal protein S18 acetylase RimI-like enzyme